MNSFSKLCISPRSKVLKAIRLIDQGSVQFVFVLDTKNRLVGIVTDGDIRRGLLRGETLESRVEHVMNKKFKYLSGQCSKSQAKDFMLEEGIHQVPVIDANGRVVQLFLLDDFFTPEQLSNWVVLMAGGKGKRLLPHTEECPKPMLPVGGKPMLEIILEQCINAGFKNYFISVNYLKQQIQEYFEDGSKWGIEISYLEETQPMGTAGGLGLLPIRPEHEILVINSDVLTRVDFSKLLNFHAEHCAYATVCVRNHETLIPYGVVSTEEGQVHSFIEKPVIKHYINAGIYVLKPDLLNLLTIGEPIDMPQLLELALEEKLSVAAFPIHEYWLDVGHPETFEQANGDWS